MKTAEEWLTETDVSHPNTDLVKLVEQIQLDAMKEGMRMAAEIASDREPSGELGIDEAIFSAAEQLTIKDLEV